MVMEKKLRVCAYACGLAQVTVKNPSNVIAGFEDSVGGTFFHLNDMQVCVYAGIHYASN